MRLSAVPFASAVTILMLKAQTVCLQLVATANAFVWTFITMPHLPQDHAAAVRVRFQTHCYLLSLLDLTFFLQYVRAVLQTLPSKISKYTCANVEQHLLSL